MKRKAMIPLALGLVIGIFAVKTAFNAFQKAQATQQATTIKVLLATTDIPPLEAITPDMVQLVETPASPLLPPGEHIASVEDVVGRVTAKPIPVQVPILESMLAPKGTPAGMVGRIPPGYRAFSVRIDEVTGVAYQIRPGDWVDVIVVMDMPSATGRKETVAEVVLQRVQVAAIGNTTTSSSKGGLGGSKSRPAKSATLLVREEDVPKLHLAATQGKITLAMRGDDETITETPSSASFSAFRQGQHIGSATTNVPAWLESFLGWGTHQADSAPVTETSVPTEPPPPYGVVVYRASNSGDSKTDVERITFQNAQSSKIVSVAFGPPTKGLGMIASSKQKGRAKPPRKARQAKSRKSSRKKP